ncbi:NeuD/PglB/VioB family sugar acetyltransferase [Actinobacillus delphinicola]|uniref:Nnad n=1 Tax=Actinobacillus delphinicola TaxID=51161 RepID=A0A448TV68_9PAST|nr:NeuD/PglB/VioB family sugar acetyltransferase [Actinobacillus delphinicola]VEJ09828.1 nnad [Actinobacillus delphinicola]
MKEIILIGAGGYAKSVLDSLDLTRYKFKGYIDRLRPVGSTHLGFPVLANNLLELKDFHQYSYFIAIGNNDLRYENYTFLKKNHCNIINIIDKTSIISSSSYLGEGVFVGKMAIINAGVKVGNNVIVNTKALLEHGVTIENHCNISTNTTLNGDVYIGEKSFIGSSSVINGQLEIGNNVVVGSGSVVIRDIDPNSIVVGIPAKVIKKLDSNYKVKNNG